MCFDDIIHLFVLRFRTTVIFRKKALRESFLFFKLICSSVTLLQTAFGWLMKMKTLALKFPEWKCLFNFSSNWCIRNDKIISGVINFYLQILLSFLLKIIFLRQIIYSQVSKEISCGLLKTLSCYVVYNKIIKHEKIIFLW